MRIFRVPDPEPKYDHQNEIAFRREVERALSENPSLPNFTRYTNANLPAAGAKMDGRLVFDTTNNRFVGYANGVRFYVAGTLF